MDFSFDLKSVKQQRILVQAGYFWHALRTVFERIEAKAATNMIGRDRFLSATKQRDGFTVLHCLGSKNEWRR